MNVYPSRRGFSVRSFSKGAVFLLGTDGVSRSLICPLLPSGSLPETARPSPLKRRQTGNAGIVMVDPVLSSFQGRRKTI